MAAAIIGGAGLNIVKASEGLRTKTYIDPVGIPTVCYGHTGPEVKLGQTYTVQQCEDILLADIAKHRKGVEGCIKAPLSPNQRDAATSFAFNIGVTKFCNSTLAKKLNRADYIGAADEFPKWKNGTINGKLVPLPGLVTRRHKERNLFLTPYYGDTRIASAAALKAILGAS